jgi:hypothetical protein
MKLVGFVILDILEPIDHTAADFQVRRPCLQPAPPFQDARTDAPTAGEMNLVKMAEIQSAHWTSGKEVRNRRSSPLRTIVRLPYLRAVNWPAAIAS